MAAFNKQDRDTIKKLHYLPKKKSDLQDMIDQLDEAQMSAGVKYNKFEITAADKELNKPKLGPDGVFYKSTLPCTNMLKLIGGDKNSTTSTAFPVGQKDGVYYAICAEPDDSAAPPEYKFGWQRFTPPKANWSVLMPNEPEPGRAALAMQAGTSTVEDPDAYGVVRNTASIKTTQHLFSCGQEGKRENAPDNKQKYHVSCTTYSAETLKDWFSDAKKNLDEAVDKAARFAEGKVTAQKEVQLNGSPGREFEIKGGNGSITIGRAYWIKDALYELTVECQAPPNRSEIDKFLTSLQVN